MSAFVKSLGFATMVVFGTLCPAAANDSTASLDTGELVLIPNADIRMEEEDLFISRDEIRVRYVFHNTGDRTITTPVAFPLPPVLYGYDANYSVEATDPENFVDFHLWVDGRRAPFRIDARATNYEGRDITGLLRRHGIPITTFTSDPASYDALRGRLDNLPPHVMQQLRDAGAIVAEDWAEGFFEAWTAHVAFWWIQDFPPDRPVVIEHRYTPVPTQTFFTPYDLEARTHHQQACIDANFEAAARRRMAETEYETLSLTLINYILTTGNNWHGPIGRFHLTVDKGATNALVSLCRDGIRKTGPTTFEWVGRSFVPDRDLTLLFVEPFGNQ